MTCRWLLQELAHLVQGCAYSLLLSWVTGVSCWWFGAVVGLGVELYQYLGPDHHDPRLADRLADLAFWTAGGLASILL